jgi:hypothetical protein
VTYRALKKLDGTSIVGEIEVVEVHGAWWATWAAPLEDGTETVQLLRLDLVEQLERLADPNGNPLPGLEVA